MTPAGNAQTLSRLLDFETAIAHGNVHEGFRVTHSSCPGRVGKALISLAGFRVDVDGTVRQAGVRDDVALERRFVVDAIEPACAWSQRTPQTPSAQAWRTHESVTLDRYTRPLI